MSRYTNFDTLIRKDSLTFFRGPFFSSILYAYRSNTVTVVMTTQYLIVINLLVVVWPIMIHHIIIETVIISMFYN